MATCGKTTVSEEGRLCTERWRSRLTWRTARERIGRLSSERVFFWGTRSLRPFFGFSYYLKILFGLSTALDNTCRPSAERWLYKGDRKASECGSCFWSNPCSAQRHSARLPPLPRRAAAHTHCSGRGPKRPGIGISKRCLHPRVHCQYSQ